MQTLNQIEEAERYNWFRLGVIFGHSVLIHPFEYAKILMQLGYEPILPRPGRTILGDPVLIYPNVFKYALFIKEKVGLSGCYCGLCPKLIALFLSFDVTGDTELCLEEFNDRSSNNRTVQSTSASTPSSKVSAMEYEKIRQCVILTILLSVVDCIITHPFHVISIRMMAQFVGGETYYSSLIGSFKEILKQDGILGFYSGVAPRLIHGVVFSILNFSATYSINKYIPCNNFVKNLCGILMRAIFSSMLYPWTLVSVCMMVSGTKLSIGSPPFMPVYNSWYDCFMDLREKDELKRGSSMILRYKFLPKISEIFYIKDD